MSNTGLADERMEPPQALAEKYLRNARQTT